MLNEFQGYLSKIDNFKRDYNRLLSGIIDYERNGDDICNSSFFPGIKKVTQDIIDKKINEFDKRINEIKKLKKEIILLDLSVVEKKFLINSLNQTAIKYMLLKRAIYLEAEKQGFTLSNKDRGIYLKEVNRLQDMVYGPEISLVQGEKYSVLNSLKDLFINNGNKLSQEEKSIFSDFLLGFGIIPNFSKSNSKGDECEKLLCETFISKETFRKIFEIVLDIYGLNEWKVSIEKVGNFSVKKEKKQIVCPEEKIENTNLKRLFQLIDHEIGVHVIRGYNVDKTLKISGEGYLEGEEGFAVLSELMFDSSLENIHLLPTIHHITTFIGENFDAEKTQKLLEIYFKLTGMSSVRAKNEAKDRTLRVKRYVSFKEKGANRKDVSYTRGQVQVVDFLQSSGLDEQLQFLKDFYYSKLSLDDLELVKDFKKLLGAGEDELKYPLWIGKILYKKLIGEKIFLEKLKEEDFRFNAIDRLSFSQKRKIVEILQIVR